MQNLWIFYNTEFIQKYEKRRIGDILAGCCVQILYK
jgi:hypothetical protein